MILFVVVSRLQSIQVGNMTNSRGIQPECGDLTDCRDFWM